MTYTFNPFTGKLDRVAAPGGTGTEIQYRSGATTLGAIAGSNVDPATGNTTFSARWISTRNSAAGAPAHTLTGTWFTGGTAESTKPHFLIEPTGSLSNNWNVNGTGLGVNAPNGFTGDLASLRVNGTRHFSFATNGLISATGLPQVQLGNGAGTSNTVVLYGAGVGSGFSLQAFSDVYVSVNNALPFGWSSSVSAALDLALHRDAANTLAQRNGGTGATPVPQTYRIANYQASTADFERAYLSWASNVFRVGTEKGTTGGTARAIEIQTDGITRSQWTRDGFFRRLQPAPVAVNTTATLTVANIQAGIITTTTAAAVDMTLPTGTDMEGGYAVHAADLASEWSIINTGSNAATIIAATDHTIVGSAAVAGGTSGRFATRRSAANTYITYRIN